MRRKLLKVFLVVCLMMMVAPVLDAAAIAPGTKVYGYVKNTAGTPLSGVKVTLYVQGDTNYVYTDSTGKYTIIPLIIIREPTSARISFSKSGYYYKSIYFTLVPNKTIRKDATLTKLSGVYAYVKSRNGLPLTSVKVSLINNGVTKAIDYTDSAGRYDLYYPSPGPASATSVTIRFEKANYKTKEMLSYVYPQLVYRISDTTLLSSHWGTGGKYAIVIGISDYQSISDLSYCDEDATDWYNFLTNKGYEVHVYGDNHQSNYPRYDGLATEATIRSAIQLLAAQVQSGEQVVITTAGHGGADETNGWKYSGGGESNDYTAYLYMYDSSGSGSTSGNYYETEITADLSRFTSGVCISFIIDNCHSGAIGPNVAALNNYADILFLTTCSGNGYGYDDPTHNNGKFTYWVLEAFNTGSQTTFEDAFNWLMNDGRYLPVSNNADRPQKFDGNTAVAYTP